MPSTDARGDAYIAKSTDFAKPILKVPQELAAALAKSKKATACSRTFRQGRSVTTATG